ncbi:hypothetical protein CYMTET_56966 [Cymbomonas tetramitiformis]|uniref:Uncharacterized protein n=1 Tax=Cymbomonas tetramitiformis TaxID=36881 RepID=A0AAE0BA88_9CHLO|nr:hypothetical protein CYMTET_56966 [Cymbomonas tetramitiformis]
MQSYIRGCYVEHLVSGGCGYSLGLVLARVVPPYVRLQQVQHKSAPTASVADMRKHLYLTVLRVKGAPGEPTAAGCASNEGTAGGVDAYVDKSVDGPGDHRHSRLPPSGVGGRGAVRLGVYGAELSAAVDRVQHGQDGIKNI